MALDEQQRKYQDYLALLEGFNPNASAGAGTGYVVSDFGTSQFRPEVSYTPGTLADRQTRLGTADEQLMLDEGVQIAREQTKRRRLAELQRDPEIQERLALDKQRKEVEEYVRSSPALERSLMEARAKAQIRPRTITMADPKDPTKAIIVDLDTGRKIGDRAPSASIAGQGTFTPQTLEFVAKQYLAGDRQVVLGFARNATARIALQNAIVDEAAKRGISPEQTAAQIADFAGVMAGSRTVGQRAANISLAATEAQEMIGIVKESSDKFARTQFVPWNVALRAYETQTGEPEIAEFGAAVNALVNVYARAINPTGQPTVSDKEHARAVLNTIQSPAQVDAVLGIIRRELEIAKKAPRQVQAATRQRVTGETPIVVTPPSGEGWTPEKERRYQELLRKRAP